MRIGKSVWSASVIVESGYVWIPLWRLRRFNFPSFTFSYIYSSTINSSHEAKGTKNLLRIAAFSKLLEAIYTDSTHPVNLWRHTWSTFGGSGTSFASWGEDPTKTSETWICWSSLHPRRNQNTESWRGGSPKIGTFWNLKLDWNFLRFLLLRSACRIRFRWRPGGWYCISEWIDPRLNHLTLPYPATSWMSRWKLGSMLRIDGLFQLLIHGLYWGYK